MRKIATAAIIAMLSIVVNAATYNWSVKAGWVSPDDDNGWSGNTVYAFDGNAYSTATLIAAFGTVGSDALNNALGSGVVDEEFLIEGSGLTAVNSKSSMYAVLVATGTDGKDYAYIMNSASDVNITSAIEAGAKATFNFGDVVTGAAGSSGWYAVPEPTSGLLLLLGVAGLALKRKRA